MITKFINRLLKRGSLNFTTSDKDCYLKFITSKENCYLTGYFTDVKVEYDCSHDTIKMTLIGSTSGYTNITFRDVKEEFITLSMLIKFVEMSKKITDNIEFVIFDGDSKTNYNKISNVSFTTKFDTSDIFSDNKESDLKDYDVSYDVCFYVGG